MKKFLTQFFFLSSIIINTLDSLLSTRVGSRRGKKDNIYFYFYHIFSLRHFSLSLFIAAPHIFVGEWKRKAHFFIFPQTPSKNYKRGKEKLTLSSSSPDWVWSGSKIGRSQFLIISPLSGLCVKKIFNWKKCAKRKMWENLDNPPKQNKRRTPKNIF
jgi:hypothetical protein